MSFSIIAAIGKNRELGKGGKLLWRLPGDMEFFKRTTMGHPILMGHKTFDSLPKMLPGRKHYVVTRKRLEEIAADKSSVPLSGPPRQRERTERSVPVTTGDATDAADGIDDLAVVNNLQDFIKQNEQSKEEIFVIGGGMVYWEMMKYSNVLYLTEVAAEDADADTFFPEFDKSKYQKEILGKGEDNGIKYTFVRYTKLK